MSRKRSRRHTNTTGYRQIKNGQTRKQVARMAKRLGIPVVPPEKLPYPERLGESMEQQWIVYDERANSLAETEDASVLVCEGTEKKALAWPGRGYVWKYDVAPDGKTLINEQYVGPTKVLEKNQ